MVNHWALRVFAEEIKEVELTIDMSLLKEDLPPELPLCVRGNEAMIEAMGEREVHLLLWAVEEAGKGLKNGCKICRGALRVPLTFSSSHHPESRRVG